MNQKVLDRLSDEFHHRGRDVDGSVLPDYIFHYMVHKKSSSVVDMQKFMDVIVAYSSLYTDP